MTDWVIRGIALPIEPKSFKKKTTRTQKQTAIVGDFPDPTINQPTKFEFEIQGFIYPRKLAQELDEATKNAETEDLTISVSTLGVVDEWLSGLYSVTRSSVARDKPIFDASSGGEVFTYKITFAGYAELGSDQNADEAGPDGDEETAFMDMPDEVGFDANGDGKVNQEEFFNWFTNIMTFGVFGA